MLNLSKASTRINVADFLNECSVRNLDQATTVGAVAVDVVEEDAANPVEITKFW